MTEHRIDILINRIVDKVETQSEWAEFRALAATEPSAWELLAEAQRDDDRLRRLAHDATAFVEGVELPEALPSSRSSAFRRAFSSGAGWAAAAAIVLAWIATGPFGGARGANPTQTAGFSLDADAAWRQYLDRGQSEGVVVGELEPKVLLDTKELPQGGYEVVFVRQIVERRQVPVILRSGGTDEQGVATPVVVRPRPRGAL
jgi:hypothetical protein